MKDPRIIRDNTQVGSGNALQEKLLVISNAEERNKRNTLVSFLNCFD